ncbi:hypothetical protein DICPUDRAFT_25134 [Dictyostelium purpureum]|uniref:Vacuolar protein sorting-associated protein 54 C-terminal domain-containing protein n=1 Tax=Dictyostelium purpureum TaxID=5786 RepID=F0Z6I0_DICPU|nr:uncharacterized protein DICPUDRAFT_25134 [Dictyostelium purpureum]EGC40444.1 hypothetical protein DICPUDRAFT_25134 [Dictyostelium purpureum]|eukprot:XP_003282991.1 hypothetical protein DICPUDRAFT_25134 [Dictyostelium purpureum]
MSNNEFYNNINNNEENSPNSPDSIYSLNSPNINNLNNGDNSNYSNYSNNNGTTLSRSLSSILFDNQEPFVFAQSLTSVCMDPTSPINNEWQPSDLQIPQHPNPQNQLLNASNITIQSFQSYLNKIKPVYKIFKENQNKELIPTNKKTQEEIISLENIPAFFFKKNMTINEILSYADNDPSPIIFQKLEHYHTIIEENIVGHVRDKSLSFFSAMSELKLFRQQLLLLSNHIKDSENFMALIDKNCIDSLNISKLFLQKNRIKDTMEILSLVSQVKQAQPALQLLLSKNDYMGALELISSTQHALNLDLGHISSLKNLAPQLLEMVHLVEKMSLDEFIRVSLNDNLLNNNSNNNSPILNNNNNDMNNSNNDEINLQSLSDNIQIFLLPLITVILKVDRIQEALEEFRDASIESVKSLFRNTVANITYQLLDSGNSSHHKTPTNNFNSNNFNWNDCKLKLLKLSSNDSLPLFKSVDQAFRKKFIIISKIIQLIIERVNNLPNEREKEEQELGRELSSSDREKVVILAESVTNTCNSVMYSIVETMHERISSLLKVRSEINAKLALPDFVQFYNQIESFLKFTDSFASTLLKRKVPILRSALISQIKQFLDILHKNRMSSLTLLLENEDWIQVKVVSEFQQIVNNIVKNSLDQPLDDNNNIDNCNNGAISTDQQQQADIDISDEIFISTEPFKVVNTLLMLLKFLSDYLSCCEKLPSIIIDSIPKIIELLNTFNSMTYQLVLCAGARQTMKLKTITSKHLGYASQSLSFQIKLIPYIKTILQRSLNTKQYSLLNGLDKLLQDFSTHRQEIFDKFIVIVKERSIYHLKQMAAMELKDDTLPIPTPPIAALLKDILTLHKLLSSILPAEQLFKVFTGIYFMFNPLFMDFLTKIDLSHKISRRRIHNDVLHILNSLRQLNNAGDPGNDIEVFLNQNFPM